MARGHPPPHCENTQVLREAITEDDDDVAKTKGLISCAVTAQLICAFDFPYMQKAGFLMMAHFRWYCCLFSQVKAIEKHDSVLTSSQQIDRLLRPGSTYFNLNPFDVSA